MVRYGAPQVSCHHFSFEFDKTFFMQQNLIKWNTSYYFLAMTNSFFATQNVISHDKIVLRDKTFRHDKIFSRPKLFVMTKFFLVTKLFVMTNFFLVTKLFVMTKFFLVTKLFVMTKFFLVTNLAKRKKLLDVFFQKIFSQK